MITMILMGCGSYYDGRETGLSHFSMGTVWKTSRKQWNGPEEMHVQPIFVGFNVPVVAMSVNASRWTHLPVE